MKNLHMKSLATAVLIGGSLLASTGAMATVGSGTVANDVAGAGLVNTPASSCEAYNAGQEELLIANFSSLGATASVWTHCPIAAPAVLLAASGISMNLQMPISSTSTVYNCYVAQQGLNSSAATAANRTVVWGRNSAVGNVSVGFGAPVTLNGHSATTTPAASTFALTTFNLPAAAPAAIVAASTYTSGCLLGPGDQLHSFQMNAL